MDYTTLIMVAVVIAAGYFLMVRPAQKRQADQQKTVSAIQPGTRVMTTSGVFGTVRHLGERQAVIEIAPGIEMTVIKAAIARVAKPEEDEFEYEDEAEEALSAEQAEDDGFGQAIAGFDAPDAIDPQLTRSDASDAVDLDAVDPDAVEPDQPLDPEPGPDYQGYPKPDDKN